jgi:CRP-like cAMP-binding protein
LWRTLHDGSACTLLTLGPGELIGSVAVAQATPHLTCATAMTPVEVICWHAGAFRTELRTSTVLPAAFLAIVARRAAQLLDRVEDIANLPVEKRLARAILRFAGENGTHDDALAVIVSLRQQDLADMALTTVPTVSRILAAWAATGIAFPRRGKVVVPHLTRLALVAGLHLD